MMKKLLLFPLAMLAAAFTLISCLNKYTYEEDPLDPGRDMYNRARTQQNCAMDGANIAFRLNILLNEIREQQDNGLPFGAIDLDDVKFILNPGPTQQTKSLTDFLFGDATIDSISIGGRAEGFRISYPVGYNSGGAMSDYQRKGSLRIDTKGKLLNELELSSEYWDVLDDDAPNAKMQLIVGGDYGSETTVTVKYGDYAIWRSDEHDYSVNIDGYGSRFDGSNSSQLPLSDWSGYVDIYTSFGETLANWDYNNIAGENTSLEIDASMSGKSMYLLYEGVSLALMYDTYEPIVHKPGGGCSWLYFESGEEEVRVLNSEDVSSVYPSKLVKVKWSPKSGACKPNVIITYNGQTASQ